MLTTFSPRYYLAIDIGGAHTEALITDESGFQLGRSVLDYGANPHNGSYKQTMAIVAKAIAAARANVGYTKPEKEKG